MQKEEKTLSIHQPNFIPWLGYFHKIKKSDVFIILDTVQLPRGKSIANRNKIKSAQGELELVVPVAKPKGNEGKITYKMARIADAKWAKKALKAMELNYKKATHFQRYFPVIKELFQHTDFCQMNISFIHFVVRELNIGTDIHLLSQIDNADSGQKNELIINICRHFDANVYLSGRGAEKYNDPELLKKHGIRLDYQQFEHPAYTQLHNNFIPNLSIVDILMNHGPESRNYL